MTRVAPALLRFAAQADLVALAAEMLRSPQSVASQVPAPWFTEPVESYLPLFDAALPLDVSSDELSTLRQWFAELHAVAVEPGL